MWKKLCSLFILHTFFVTAQSLSTGILQFHPTDTIQGSYTINPGSPYIFITSGFGSDQIAHTAVLDSISGFLIKEIVLVYSRYHKQENFNQIKLNNSRWDNLEKNYPSLFGNGTTAKRNVCQDVLSDTGAKKLTHGFYIYYENSGDSVKREKEIEQISSVLQSLGVDTSAASEPEKTAGAEEAIDLSDSKKRRSKFSGPMKTKDPKACRQPFYKSGIADLEKFFAENIELSAKQKRNPKELTAEVRLKLDYNGFIRNAYILVVDKSLPAQIKKALYNMEPWNPGVRNGVIIKTDVKFILQYKPDGTMGIKGGVTVPSYLAKCGTTPDEELFDFSKKDPKEKKVANIFQVADNTIFREVVKRNKTVDSLLLVVDLTGSMGPYIAQVLDLMAELVISDKPHVSCISLFNDGDKKADKNKQVGSTGGITILNDKITLDKLGAAVLRSMKNGTGGDAMENNIEATIKGLNSCKDCKDIIMIADNFANPRDGSLISKIDRPIHWVLCGVQEGINVHYLELIRLNRGILHTNESDVYNLHMIKENETMTIDGYSYRYARGKFSLVK